ncbi:toll/interleukin-1 receptor domain-containing protein [Variovorax sp. LjRoot175]|uniref:toll/interleukin-1 receptor domain-containing protein n=1 Tax=Variovorax sp. LjRoot175 TaxID=3342276 RepID=UPI003ECF627D
MLGDAVRAIIDLLMLRKTEKRLDADIKKAPVDLKKAELEVEKTVLEIARLERENVPPGVIISPDQISVHDIQTLDPRAAAVAANARRLSAFVSFGGSDSDYERARELSAALTKQHEISAFTGDDVLHSRTPRGAETVTDRALNRADVFVILLSQDTAQSIYVAEELKHALRKGKLIIPVFAEGFEFEEPWPDPFDQLRNISALYWGSMRLEEVADAIAARLQNR